MTRAVNWIIRLVLGGTFIFAGTLKILDPADFAANITNYRMFPEHWVNLVAIMLPWIEVVAGLCLVTGFWPRASALVIGGMCVVFVVAVGQALARGLDLHCGCFGTVSATRLGLKHLLIDVALLAMAAWLVWRERRD